MSRGHIRQRGARSWELKFDSETDTGKRKTNYHSFKGGKREAQARLAELIASAGRGDYVPPTKITIGEYVRMRIDQWEAAGNLTARTTQRYRQLLKNQVVPHLGTRLLQKLTRLDVEDWPTRYAPADSRPARSATVTGCSAKPWAMRRRTAACRGTSASFSGHPSPTIGKWSS
jgi:hypothetical protein